MVQDISLSYSILLRGTGFQKMAIASSLYYSRTFSNNLRNHLKLVFADRRGFSPPYNCQNISQFQLETLVDDIELVRKELGWDKVIVRDTLEDTETTYNEWVSEFRQEVSEIVFAVTNEPGTNRAERFRKTAQKIVANKKFLIVKLADRIANTEASLKTNLKLFCQMYVKKFPLFKKLLYTENDVGLLPM